MTKSIYSLLLSDELVRELDRRAYSMNTSRSALANQILADALSFVTPEKRMRDIFSEIERFFGDSSAFQLTPQPSDSMLSLRTALAFKYNPQIRYSVELYKGASEQTGKITVRLRSQNSDLLCLFSEFFKLWHGIECRFCGEVTAFISDGKYERIIKGFGGRELSERETGAFISEYLKLLDSSLKLYFSLYPDTKSAYNEINSDYSEFTNTNKEVLL